jgi:hypothetical protein
MAATWLIALVRTTTHDLLTTAQANAALAMDAIQERSTAALLLMSNIAGEALHEEPTAAQGAIVNAWRAQPDSEDLILSAFNSLFAQEARRQRFVGGDTDGPRCGGPTMPRRLAAMPGFKASFGPE